MTRDFYFALRMIRSYPWFSAAVVATLAMGIGVNTTVFTLVNAVMFKPLPFRDGDRIVALRGNNLSQGQESLGISYSDYLDYKKQSTAFEFLEANRPDQGALSERGNPPEMHNMGRVTGGFFEMLGTQPVLGRTLRAADAEAGAEPVVVISDVVWRDRYGRAKDVVGRTVRVNDQQAVIVGVMPEHFGFPNVTNLWMALTPTPEMTDRGRRSLLMIGVRKPGVSIAQASADLNVVAKRLEAAYPDTNKGVGARVLTFHEFQNGGQIRTVFFLMLGAVGFVLLIACANVANMMLSRSLGRTRELSIRSAMGASRWRIVRQLLIESVVLSFLGGAIGLAMARYGVLAFDNAVANVGKPSWIEFTMNYQVFVYFAAICLLSGLVFGLIPGLRASRVDLNDALKEGGRTAGSTRGGMLSGALVVFQFTLAVVLLAGAGLFLRGFFAQRAFGAGLPADHVMTAQVQLPEKRYADNDARLRFFEQFLGRLGNAVGVTRAALVSNLPGGGGRGPAFQLEGEADKTPAQRPHAILLTASPGYFPVIDLPMLAGRDFNERDGSVGNEAAIVTKDFAQRSWPDQSPLGKRFRTYRGPAGKETAGSWLTVVGVTADLAQRPSELRADPLLFIPYRPGTDEQMSVMLRTSGDAAPLAGALRNITQQMDPDLALDDVRTLTAALDQQGWYLRVFGSIFSVFALVALGMASVGIYAVVAQATGRRTKEIGLRMALGATPHSISRLVLGRGMLQLAIGLTLGLAAAFGATRLMTSLLYRVSPTDPVVFVSVALLLTGVGLLACWLPARRAAALDPVKALRQE
ncbi:MAG: ABC transporter permease [Acidobacteriota bacterium]